MEPQIEKLVQYVLEELLVPLRSLFYEQLGEMVWSSMVTPVVSQIEQMLQLAGCTRIGFVGERGSGKTTLLNALLGIKKFLPTKSIQTATSAIVEIKYSEVPYKAKIRFIDSQQYQLLLNGDESEFTPELQEKWKALQKHKRSPPEEQLRIKSAVETGFLQLEQDDPECLSKSLLPYVSHSEALWSLVDWIHVEGPFPGLQQYGMVSLLDIPGTGDGYAALAALQNHAISACDSLFYLPLHQQCGNEGFVLGKLVELPSGVRKGVVITHLNNLLADMEDDLPPNCSPLEFSSYFRRLIQLDDSFPIYSVELLDKNLSLDDFKQKEFNLVASRSVDALQNRINSLLDNFQKLMSVHSKRHPTLGDVLVQRREA
jgi:hypothetical protein